VKPFAVTLSLLFILQAMLVPAADLGVFEGETDVGKPAKGGSATIEEGNYIISGGGANMWFTNDAFHFVWKRVSGDFSLRAAVDWMNSGGNAHRKACLIVRQGLEPDSAYVDVAVHGEGLISLQYRDAAGTGTHEVQARPSGSAGNPWRVGLERQGDTFFMSAPGSAGSRSAWQAEGAFTRIKLADPVYVGLGVCAHDDTALEKARFSEVAFRQTLGDTNQKPVLHCALETISISSKDRRLVYHTTNHIEAPNWSRDNRYLLFNGGGHLYRIPPTGGNPEVLDTAFANRCNNDHGVSADGTRLAISDQSKERQSLIYVLPAAGGTPRQVTMLGPSYWHGWSPDGSTLAFCGQRDGEFDVYTIPAEGGTEKRLTTAKGLDDGPEYSPDGKYIYFNSDRTRTMQIWRMKPDGTEQEQVTSDNFNNWFAHPSPDGKWLVFLSYEKDVEGHPENQPVRLRMMPTTGTGPIQELARLFGGQGTINVPSWSPDSKQVAFVSYELIRPERE
jgi:TolB protein